MSIPPDNTHPLYPALERAAIAAWSGELPFSQRALAEAIAPELGDDPGRIAATLPQFLRLLARDGVYTSQRARHGSKTDGPNQLTSPQCFNWSPVSPEDATLRRVAGPFLADEGVAEHRKHALRSALRFGLELAVKCSDDALLKACEAVPAADLYALPGRVHDAARSRPEPLSKQTSQNHRSVIRSAMRYAAERRLVPIIFPQLWSDDAWERDKALYFPLAAEGTTSAKVAGWRSAWNVFGETFTAMHSELPSELKSVTREIAEAVITRMQVNDGRYAMGYQARGALRYLARQHGVGPFVEPSATDAFFVETPSGPRPALYLRGANGEAGSADWDVFFGVLAAHGLPPALTEFLQWYREYVTLPGIEIITRKDKFPPRRERTRLDENTLNERPLALRAFLGAALYELAPAADVPGSASRSAPRPGPPKCWGGRSWGALWGPWWLGGVPARRSCRRVPSGKAGAVPSARW